MSGTQHCHGLHHRQCRLCSSPAPSTSLSFVWLYLLFMCASCPIHMQFSARNDHLPTNNCDYAEVPISERSGWKQKDIISFISIDLSLKKGVKGANMSRITERCTFQSTPDRSPKKMQCRRTVWPVVNTPHPRSTVFLCPWPVHIRQHWLLGVILAQLDAVERYGSHREGLQLASTCG